MRKPWIRLPIAAAGCQGQSSTSSPLLGSRSLKRPAVACASIQLPVSCNQKQPAVASSQLPFDQPPQESAGAAAC